MPHKSNFATLRKAQNLNWISTNFPKAKLVPQSKHCQRACAREKIRTNEKLINKFRASKNHIGIFFIFIQKSIFWFRIGILKPLLIIFEIVRVCSTQFSAFCVRKNTFSNEFVFRIRSAKCYFTPHFTPHVPWMNVPLEATSFSGNWTYLNERASWRLVSVKQCNLNGHASRGNRPVSVKPTQLECACLSGQPVSVRIEPAWMSTPLAVIGFSKTNAPWMGMLLQGNRTFRARGLVTSGKMNSCQTWLTDCRGLPGSDILGPTGLRNSRRNGSSSVAAFGKKAPVTRFEEFLSIRLFRHSRFR